VIRLEIEKELKRPEGYDRGVVIDWYVKLAQVVEHVTASNRTARNGRPQRGKIRTAASQVEELLRPGNSPNECIAQRPYY
jgi:hypothetical protein